MNPFADARWQLLHAAAVCWKASSNVFLSRVAAAFLSSGRFVVRSPFAMAGMWAVGPSFGSLAPGTSSSNISSSSPISNPASS